MVGRFPAIEVYNPAFANNSTDVVVNGEGKNLSVFNSLWDDGKLIYGLFERIVIPTAETRYDYSLHTGLNDVSNLKLELSKTMGG